MPNLKVLEVSLPQGMEYQDAQFLKARSYQWLRLPMGSGWSLSLSGTTLEAQLGEAASAED
jgi:hypothetical protein